MASLRMKESKQDVKSKIQATDEEWNLLETETRYFYKSNTNIFESNVMWSKLDAEKVKEAIALLEEQCRAKNLKLKDMQDVLYWKMYQHHKSAKTTNRNKFTKDTSPDVGSSTNPSASMSEPGSSTPYDPVKDAAKNRK